VFRPSAPYRSCADGRDARGHDGNETTGSTKPISTAGLS
jgi:hypothetical protein